MGGDSESIAGLSNVAWLYPHNESLQMSGTQCLVVLRFTFHPSCFPLNSPFHSQINVHAKKTKKTCLKLLFSPLYNLRSVFHETVPRIRYDNTCIRFFFYHMDETRRVMHYKLGVVALYRSGPRRPCEVHPSWRCIHPSCEEGQYTFFHFVIFLVRFTLKVNENAFQLCLTRKRESFKVQCISKLSMALNHVPLTRS